MSVGGVEVAAPFAGPRLVHFRRRARWVIAGFVVLFAIGTLVQRAVWPPDPRAQYDTILGESHLNVMLFFGVPQRQAEDGSGGQILGYDEWVVVGDHFELHEFRIFVNADARVYKFERD